jgi:hypothetical protein
MRKATWGAVKEIAAYQVRVVNEGLKAVKASRT